MKFVCVGQASYDVTYCVNEYPVENKKMRVDHVVECGGGSASNAAYLLGKWGSDVSFIGSIGNDCYGKLILNEFENNNVDISYVEIDNVLSTPSSLIINNLNNATRTILSYREKGLKYKNDDINIVADVILMDTREIETAVRIMKKNPNAITILDAGACNDLTKTMGKYVNYLVTSKNFAEEYTNIKIDLNDVSTISKVYEIMEKTYKNTIVITLEENGCLYKEDGIIKLMPTIKVKAKDTTGAGDIFHGAFTYAIANNYSLSEALKLANVTASLSVRKIGSRNSVSKLEEVMKVFEKV